MKSGPHVVKGCTVALSAEDNEATVCDEEEDDDDDNLWTGTSSKSSIPSLSS